MYAHDSFLYEPYKDHEKHYDLDFKKSMISTSVVVESTPSESTTWFCVRVRVKAVRVQVRVLLQV